MKTAFIYHRTSIGGATCLDTTNRLAEKARAQGWRVHNNYYVAHSDGMQISQHLEDLLEQVNEHCVIVCASIDRISRDVKRVIEFVQRLRLTGCGLYLAPLNCALSGEQLDNLHGVLVTVDQLNLSWGFDPYLELEEEDETLSA